MSETTVFALFFIKLLVLIYDLLTIPIYLIFQRPWTVLSHAHRKRASRLREDDPYSSWVRIGVEPETFFTKLAETAKTMPEIFEKVCEIHGDKPCSGIREVYGEEDEQQPNGKIFKKLILADEYQWTSYKETNKKIEQLIKGFIATGIRSGDKVVIFAESRPEWMLSFQALGRMGATVVTLYATLGEDGIIHSINEPEATHVITSSELLPKIFKNEDKLSTVQSIIYLESVIKKPLKINDKDKERFKIFSLNKVIEMGQIIPDDRRRADIIPPKPEDLAIIMYTSGSTGVPKGVMISHRNFLVAAQTIVNTILSEYKITNKDRLIGYLPLAHIFELAAENFMMILGVPVGYSGAQTLLDSGTAIKKGCKGDVSVLKPTIVPAVPLILDRIRKGIVDGIVKKGDFAKGFLDFALEYKKFWTKKGFSTPLINKLVCEKIKSFLGGEVRMFIVGGAPLSPETQEFLTMAFDTNLIQGYAATEASAASTIMDLYDMSYGRVGAPLYGVQLKLIDWREGSYFATDLPNPRGEILIGGEFITMGYYKNEAQTKEYYVEEDGVRWWYTGDIGEIYADGTLKIIDRKKDLVKLQFGEYISLGKVETELKNSDYVDNICVCGDSFHSNLVALIVPNKTNLKALAARLGKSNLTLSEMCIDADIISSVRKSLVEIGTKSGLLRMEIPSEIKLCDEEWVPDTGLVTAALKIRRKQIQDYYKTDITKMYSRNGSSKST